MLNVHLHYSPQFKEEIERKLRALRAAVGIEPDHRRSRQHPTLGSFLGGWTTMEIYARQGDLLIWRFHPEDSPRLPDGLKPAPDGTILRGERTGHAHRLVGTDLLVMDRPEALVDGLFAKVAEGAKVTVVHEEHDPVPLPPGDYRFSRQRVVDLLRDDTPEAYPLD